MPTLDATAKAALAGDFAGLRLIYLDILGDPIRASTGPTLTLSGTGDADLDGKTFSGIDPTLLDHGEVGFSEGGSDTLTLSLSGIVGLDSTLLSVIGAKANWQGRLARIWTWIYDVGGSAPQGAIVPFYTGYMSSIDILPSKTTQTIRLGIENYMALVSQPSNRSWLGQKDYDAADTSAAATLAAANGAKRAPGGGVGGGAGGGTGGNGNVGILGGNAAPWLASSY